MAIGTFNNFLSSKCKVNAEYYKVLFYWLIAIAVYLTISWRGIILVILLNLHIRNCIMATLFSL